MNIMGDNPLREVLFLPERKALSGEDYVYTVEDGGSNPSSPTKLPFKIQYVMMPDASFYEVNSRCRRTYACDLVEIPCD